MAETTGNPVTHINQSHYPVNGNHHHDDPATLAIEPVILNGNNNNNSNNETSQSVIAVSATATSAADSSSISGKLTPNPLTTTTNGEPDHASSLILGPVSSSTLKKGSGEGDRLLEKDTAGSASSSSMEHPDSTSIVKEASVTTDPVITSTTQSGSKVVTSSGNKPHQEKEDHQTSSSTPLLISPTATSGTEIPIESASNKDEMTAVKTVTGSKKSSGARTTVKGSVQSVSTSSSGPRRSHALHLHQQQLYHRLPPVIPEMPLRLVVHTDMVGAIIGKSGNTIKEITRESKARVDVLRKESSSTLTSGSSSSTQSLDKVINVFGGNENCMKACSKILEVIGEEVRSMDRDASDYPLRMLAHNGLIGRVIGKSGTTIKRIMESSNCKIIISPTIFDPAAAAYHMLPERVITITSNSGDNDLISVIDAAGQVFSKLRSCYESDMAMSIAPAPFITTSAPASGYPGNSSNSSPTHRMTTHFMPVHTGPSAVRSSVPRHSYPPPSSSSAMYGSSSSGLPSLMPQYPFPYIPSSSSHHPMSSAAGGFMMPDMDMGSTRETAVIYIPNACVGGVIGTGGNMIREMMHSSGATIKVTPLPKTASAGDAAAASSAATASPDDNTEPGSPNNPSSSPSTPKVIERKVTVTGTPESQWKAQMMIFRKVLMDPSCTTIASASSPSPSSSFEPSLRVEIHVPASQVGRIIGKNGQTVRELQRLTRALIKLPEPAADGSPAAPADAEIPVSILGDFFSSQNAQRQIRALVSRGQASALMSATGISYPHYDYLTGMGIQRTWDHGHGHQRQRRQPLATGGSVNNSKSKPYGSSSNTGTHATMKQSSASSSPPFGDLDSPKQAASHDEDPHEDTDGHDEDMK